MLVFVLGIGLMIALHLLSVSVLVSVGALVDVVVADWYRRVTLIWT